MLHLLSFFQNQYSPGLQFSNRSDNINTDIWRNHPTSIIQGRGKATKKLRGPNSQDGKEELLKKAPHTFVFHRGQVGKSIRELEMDLRRVMEPFTASRLKVLQFF